MIEQFEIDRSRCKPASEQIVELFKGMILDKRLQPGDRLPTSRDVVNKVGVSSQTVRQAVKVLEKSGFVKAIPGRGTFVTPNASELTHQQTERNNIRSAVKAIAIRCMVDLRGAAFSDEFHSETARGFFSECNKLNLIGTALPYNPDISKELLLEMLQKSGCEGLIWQTPQNKDIAWIEHLVKNNIAVVVTSNSTSTGNYPCVRGDNQSALYEAANYFVSGGCEAIKLFTYFDAYEQKVLDLSIPIGLKHRLEESFEIITGKAAKRVDSYHGSASGEGFSDTVIKVLEKSDNNEGVLFASAWQFYKFLEEKGQRAFDILKKRKVVVRGNRCFLIKLLPLTKDMDFYVEISSPEKIAIAAVNKLAGIINGYNSANNEIVPADFMKFKDMNFLDVIARYYPS